MIPREILRKAGPAVGTRSNSVGGLVMEVLNHEKGLRAFLDRWHQELEVYEASRPEGLSAKRHEDAWEEGDTLREELEELRQELLVYSKALRRIASARRKTKRRAARS